MKIERLKGYEDEYLIDELGHIVSIPRNNGNNQFTSYYQINGRLKKNGYVEVSLTKGGVEKYYLLHRLVAKQFIPNPENKPQVNHINGIKHDNKVCNLEWVTAKENKDHQMKVLNGLEVSLKNLEEVNYYKSYCKVELIKGDFMKTFNNTKEASVFLHCDRDRITHAIKHDVPYKGYVIKGYRHSANGELLPSNVEENPVGNGA